MRILHVTHELPPDERGGVAVYTWGLARAQASAHTVHVLSRSQRADRPESDVHEESRDGVLVTRVNRLRTPHVPLEGSYTDRKLERWFERHLMRVVPDIVHVHHWMGLGVGILDALARCRIPHVVTLHDFWSTCPRGQRLCATDGTLCTDVDVRKCGPCLYGSGWDRVESFLSAPSHPWRAWRHHALRIQRSRPASHVSAWLAALPRTVRGWIRDRRYGRISGASDAFLRRKEQFARRWASANALLAPSQFLRQDFLRQFELPDSAVTYWPYGVDLAGLDDRPRTVAPRLRFGYIGSFMESKGVRVAVQGFLEAAATRADIELHLHGSAGPGHEGYERELRTAVASNPAADRVHFHGPFDHERIQEIHAELDVVIVPSLWFENAPLTLSEAARLGTRVLTSDCGGMREFVATTGHGRTFPRGDATALALEMVRTAREPVDAGRNGITGATIRSVAEDSIALVALYERLSAERPPTSDERSGSPCQRSPNQGARS